MTTLTINKEIPVARQTAYENLGFTVHGVVRGNPQALMISKVVKTGGEKHEDINQQFRAPYLVQRAKIQRPMGEYSNVRLTYAVKLDYMGSAEFEWGAVPQSLRKVQAQFSLYQLIKVPELMVRVGDRDFILRVFANFDSDEQAAQYIQWLIEMEANKLQMKERSGLEGVIKDGKLPERNDFWWDIKNDVFFSFDKQFMNRLPQVLTKSFEVMDSASAEKR